MIGISGDNLDFSTVLHQKIPVCFSHKNFTVGAGGAISSYNVFAVGTTRNNLFV